MQQHTCIVSLPQPLFSDVHGYFFVKERNFSLSDLLTRNAQNTCAQTFRLTTQMSFTCCTANHIWEGSKYPSSFLSSHWQKLWRIVVLLVSFHVYMYEVLNTNFCFVRVVCTVLKFLLEKDQYNFWTMNTEKLEIVLYLPINPSV